MDLAYFRFQLNKIGISKQTLSWVNPFGSSQDPIGSPFRVKIFRVITLHAEGQIEKLLYLQKISNWGNVHKNNKCLNFNH